MVSGTWKNTGMELSVGAVTSLGSTTLTLPTRRCSRYNFVLKKKAYNWTRLHHTQATDVDRTISFERYKELVVEFFTSEDSNTSARHIFGPLELVNIDLALTTNSKQ